MPQPNDLSRSPCLLRAGHHPGRCHRAEPIELADRRNRARDRAPAPEEDCAGRSGPAAPAAPLARRGNPEGSHHHAHRRCLRGRPRRVLAGTVADRARDRDPRHPFDQRRGLARTQAGKDGSARHGHADARVSGLAARRTRPLRNGRGADDRGRGRQAPEPRAGEPGRRAHAHHQSHEVGAGPARHPRLQAAAAQGAAASGGAAHAGRCRRSRRTRSTKCGATSPGWPFCASRSRRSNRLAWNVWSRHRRPDRTR